MIVFNSSCYHKHGNLDNGRRHESVNVTAGVWVRILRGGGGWSDDYTYNMYMWITHSGSLLICAVAMLDM